jgi:hypothetical protein
MLRLDNCVLKTNFNPNDGTRIWVLYMECHVHFPPDPWHAEFEHEEYDEDSREYQNYGNYDQ